MSQSSTSSSLLQQHRPVSLVPQPTLERRPSIEDTTRMLERHDSCCMSLYKSSKSVDQSASIISSASNYSSSTSSSQNAVPSSSSGIGYLNIDPTCSMSHDTAQPTSSSSSTHQYDFCSKLQVVAAGALGELMPKSQWQPDESSAFCTYPLCSTIFGPPSYFSFAPRRHHCRCCGQLFCAEHSSKRALLVSRDSNNNIITSNQRVCDVCIGDYSPDNLSRRTSSESTSSDRLVTPTSEYGATASDTRSVRSKVLVNEDDDVDEVNTAPIQDWMGRDGVLSLYPLAAKAPVNPVAGPLFAPSRSARRSAKQREAERLSLRQRRMGKENGFMLSSRLSSRRNSIDEEDSDVDGEVGQLVEDGPIRYRSQMVKSPGAVRTPSEERVQFSTF